MRSELERRPLVLALAGSLIGLTAFDHPLNLLLLVPLAFLVTAMRPRLLCCLFFVVGALIRPSPQLGLIEGRTILEGVIRSHPSEGFSSQSVVLSTDRGDVRLRYSFSQIGLGERVRVRGQIKPSPDGMLMFDADSVVKTADAPIWLQWSEGWRASYLGFAAKHLAIDESQLLTAVFFSSRELMSKEMRQDFVETSALHVVTSAGLHVLLIALGLQWVMGLLPVPRWLQLALLAIVLTAFVAASGFQTSTIRAACFALFLRSAFLFRREPDPLSAACAAALLMLAFDPLQAEQLGFQLTLAAAFGFALFCRQRTSGPRTAVNRLRQSLSWSLRAGLVATVVTAPIIAQAQHSLYIDSLATGLLTSLALPAVLCLSFGLHLLSFTSQAAAGLGLKLFVAPLLGWIEAVTHFFAGVSWFHVQLPYFSGYWLLLFYGSLLATWRPRVRRA